MPFFPRAAIKNFIDSHPISLSTQFDDPTKSDKAIHYLSFVTNQAKSMSTVAGKQMSFPADTETRAQGKPLSYSVWLAGQENNGHKQEFLAQGSRGRLYRAGPYAVKSFKEADRQAAAHELAMCNRYLDSQASTSSRAFMLEGKLIMPFVQGEMPTGIEVEKAVNELHGQGFMMGDPSPPNFIKTEAGAVVPVDFGLVFGTADYQRLPAQVKTEIVHDYVKGGHRCVKGAARDKYPQVMRAIDASLGHKSPTRRMNVKVLLGSGLF